MTAEMTSHYSAHADRGTKREKMELLSSITGGFKQIESTGAAVPQIETSDTRLGALRTEIIKKISAAGVEDVDKLEEIRRMLTE